MSDLRRHLDLNNKVASQPTNLDISLYIMMKVDDRNPNDKVRNGIVEACSYAIIRARMTNIYAKQVCNLPLPDTAPVVRW